jgi:hypothetical protein
MVKDNKKFTETLHARTPEPLLTAAQLNNAQRAITDDLPRIMRDECLKHMSETVFDGMEAGGMFTELFTSAVNQAFDDTLAVNRYPQTLSELRTRVAGLQKMLPESFDQQGCSMNETMQDGLRTAFGQTCLRLEKIMLHSQEFAVHSSHVRH